MYGAKQERKEDCPYGPLFGAQVRERLRWIVLRVGKLHLLLGPQVARSFRYLLESAPDRYSSIYRLAYLMTFALLILMIPTVVGSMVYPVSNGLESKTPRQLELPYLRLWLPSIAIIERVFLVTAPVAHKASH